MQLRTKTESKKKLKLKYVQKIKMNSVMVSGIVNHPLFLQNDSVT